MAEVESRMEAGLRGATAKTNELLVNFAWHLKKEGVKEKTIRYYTHFLKKLVELGADLMNPESVKEALAKNEKWSESSKATIVSIYTSFLDSHNMTWKPPKYKQHSKLPFIPTEKEIDDLIAHSGWKLSVALKIAKETGARIGEIVKLKWSDIDKKRRTITINSAEKGSNPRILNVSQECINMIERLPKKSQYVFPSSNPEYPSNSAHFAQLLRSARRTAARKLRNPRLLNITFHTIRHWKGTMECHRGGIVHAKQILGHKNISNTMIYVHIEKAVFKQFNDEFIIKATDDLEEACKLLQVGFEYVCDMNGKKLFRKRK